MSKKCIYCGAELHLESDFCHSCVQSQIKKTKPRIPRAGRRKAVLCASAGVIAIALLLAVFGWRDEWGSGLDSSELVSPEPGEVISDPVVSTEPDPIEEISIEPGQYFAGYSGTEAYLRRELDDDRLWQLRDADIFALQESISTVADAVAYLDQFPHGRNSFFDAVDSDFLMDVAFMLDLHRTEATGPDVYTAFTGWCLADDYPAARYLISTGTCPGFTWIYHGLLLPSEAGYRIITPAGHSKHWNCVFGFEEVSVSTLEGIKEHLIPIHAGMTDDSDMFLYHLFAAEVGPTELNFWMDDHYLITTAAAEELYRMPEDASP